MSTCTITYGDVTFPLNSAKLTVQRIPMYSPAGTQQIGTAYNIRITGWLTANSQTEFQATRAAMECTLGKIGQTFKVLWNPEEVYYYNFASTAANGVADDIEWGPHPGPFTLTDNFGGLAARFEWTLRVTTKECCSGASRSSQILSVATVYQHAVDESGYTTRTVSGTLRCTSKGSPADQYRATVTPPLPSNYHRLPAQYSQSPDGLELAFSITDVEVLHTFPKPITKGQVSFSVNHAPNGVTQNYALQGYFEAPRTASKAQIFAHVINLWNNRGPDPNTSIPGERTLTEDVYGNRIQFSITARTSGGDYRFGLASFGQRPPGADGNSTIPSPYGGTGGESGLIAANPTTFDACGIPGTRPGVVRDFSPKVQGTAAATGASPPAGAAPIQRTATTISPEHKAAPYLEYHEVISYEVNNGIVVFYPKRKGAKPIFQQVSSPSLKVIQAGYAKRAGKTSADGPVVPPFILGNKGVILAVSPAVQTAEPLGDGTFKLYAVTWRYVGESTEPLNSETDFAMKYPNDPRMKDGAAGATNPLATNAGPVVNPPDFLESFIMGAKTALGLSGFP